MKQQDEPAVRSAELADPGSCDVVHVGSDAAMSRALDTHLAAAYEIEHVADGWILLRRADHRVALTVH